MKTKLIFVVIGSVAVIGGGVYLVYNRKNALQNEITRGTNSPAEESGSLLADLLAGVKETGSMQYELTMSGGGQNISQKFWLKDNKMRSETTSQGQQVVYLVDQDKGEGYMYLPSQNTAMKVEMAQVKQAVGESPFKQTETIEGYQPAIVGNEEIDGKECLVAEYSVATTKTKVWIWKEYGLPIKTESETAGEKYTTELKNIGFGEVKDDVFALPAGVRIMEIPSF